MNQIFDLRKKRIKISETKIESLVKELIKKLKAKKLFLGVMESCTGGGLANAITNVPHASEIFKGGIIAYSNEIKIKYGLSKNLIKKYSVYSPEVALAMARQAIKKIKKTKIGVGITGSLSRLDPNNPSSKIGEIFVAVVLRKKFLVRKFLLPKLKSRAKSKAIIIYQALKMVQEIIR